MMFIVDMPIACTHAQVVEKLLEDSTGDSGGGIISRQQWKSLQVDDKEKEGGNPSIYHIAQAEASGLFGSAHIYIYVA